MEEWCNGIGSLPLIIPKLDGVDIRMIEVLPVDRGPQDDIDTPPVSSPSGFTGPPAEQALSNCQPPVVFLPEFILGRSGGWISLAPEFSDKEVSLSIILELEKSRPLLRRYDVVYILLEPIVVFLGKGRTVFSPGNNKKNQCPTKEDREEKPSLHHKNTQL